MLPGAPSTPKTARMPSRIAPIQPRPASTRAAKDTRPAMVSALVPGAWTGMIPFGCWASLTKPGRYCCSPSETAWSRSGRFCRTKPKTVNASATAGKMEKKAK